MSRLLLLLLLDPPEPCAACCGWCARGGERGRAAAASRRHNSGAGHSNNTNSSSVMWWHGSCVTMTLCSWYQSACERTPSDDRCGDGAGYGRGVGGCRHHDRVRQPPPLLRPRRGRRADPRRERGPALRPDLLQGGQRPQLPGRVPQFWHWYFPLETGCDRDYQLWPSLYDCFFCSHFYGFHTYNQALN